MTLLAQSDLVRDSNEIGSGSSNAFQLQPCGAQSVELAQSASMILASVLLWFNLRAALILGLWPAAFWLFVLVLPKRKKKTPTHPSPTETCS